MTLNSTQRLSTEVTSYIFLNLCCSELLFKVQVCFTSYSNRWLIVEIVYLVRIGFWCASRLQLRVFVVLMTCRTAWLKWLKIRLFEICCSIWISSDRDLLIIGWTLVLRTTFRGTFGRPRQFWFHYLWLQLLQRVLADKVSIYSPWRRFWLLMPCIWTYCWWNLLTKDVDVGCWIIIFQNWLLLIVGRFKLTYSRIVVD